MENVTDQFNDAAHVEHQPVITPPQTSSGAPKSKKILIGLVLVIVGVLVAALGVSAYIIDRNQLTTPFALTIARIIPLSVGSVNGDPIRLSDYIEDVNTLQYFVSKKPDIAAAYTDELIRYTTFENLKRNNLLRQLAKEHKVSVSADEVQKELDAIIEQRGSREEVDRILKEDYQWDFNDFKKKVLEPSALERKLAEAISAQPIPEATQQLANDVLRKVKNGEDFSALAKQYSQDPSAQVNGGDLEYFARGVMVKEFEDAAFSLAPNTVSDLVQTPFGVHIIKVIDKRTNAESQLEEVHAFHILFTGVSISTIYAEFENNAKIVNKWNITAPAPQQQVMMPEATQPDAAATQ